MEQLGLAPQGTGEYDGIGGQLVECEVVFADEDIGGVSAVAECGDFEVFGSFGGQVFEAVDGNVDVVF